MKIDVLLSQALAENQLVLDKKNEQRLVQYLELIRSWNRVFNLTTITKPREMVYLHLIDSLLVTPFLHGTNMLDVGSGAGLPGIPLAILNSQQTWVLLDKNSKKTRFLTQAVAELGLENVQVVHANAQDFQPAACFDSILSRALGTLAMFVETTSHLLCADGRWIAMKGKHPEEELQEVDELENSVARLDVKGIDIERHIVCLRRKQNLWEK